MVGYIYVPTTDALPDLVNVIGPRCCVVDLFDLVGDSRLRFDSPFITSGPVGCVAVWVQFTFPRADAADLTPHIARLASPTLHGAYVDCDVDPSYGWLLLRCGLPDFTLQAKDVHYTRYRLLLPHWTDDCRYLRLLRTRGYTLLHCGCCPLAVVRLRLHLLFALRWCWLVEPLRLILRLRLRLMPGFTGRFTVTVGYVRCRCPGYCWCILHRCVAVTFTFTIRLRLNYIPHYLLLYGYSYLRLHGWLITGVYTR